MTDKHHCVKCGKELNERDTCGFLNEPTCLSCGYEPTENKSLGVVKYLFVFIPLFGLMYWAAINFSGV